MGNLSFPGESINAIFSGMKGEDNQRFFRAVR